MYTLTHIRETIQSHKEIVPLEITLKTTESIRKVLTQLLHIAIGKDMSSCCSGYSGDGPMLCTCAD